MPTLEVFFFKVIELSEIILKIKNKIDAEKRELGRGCFFNIYDIFSIKSNEAKKLDHFLDQIPQISNYVIYNEYRFDIVKGVYINGKFHCMNDTFIKSETSIRHYISVLGLTNSCVIGLSKHQKELLDTF